MGKLFDHTNCPNPVQWGNSPVKTVYVRDSEAGKTVWKPVGYICMGCGVFRADKSYFPSGRTGPICRPFMPSRTPIESILESEEEAPVAHLEDQSRITIAKLQKVLGISRAEVLAKVEAGEIPVEKDQYRHWSVPYSWLQEARGINEQKDRPDPENSTLAGPGEFSPEKNAGDKNEQAPGPGCPFPSP